MQKFTAENTVDDSELNQLHKTAKVLAKAYMALRVDKFTPALVQSLDDDAAQYIDYAIFKESYQALMDAKIK